MAKSSLTFSERRKVLTLGSNADHAVRTLTKQDCGKWFVLTNLQAHAITLPTASEAGEGWNCRFIVGAVQNDASVRANTTISAQGSETVSAVLKRVAATASVDAGSASTRANALDTTGVTADASNPGTCGFTITVPVAAGGTATQFTILIANDADEMPGTNAAATFVIGKHLAASDALLQAAITDAINGDVNGAVERPLTGEGAATIGLQGITAAEGASDTQISLTALRVGAAASVGTDANFITVTGGVAGLVASRSLAAGGDATGVITAGQTTTITPTGSAVGDQVELTVANGQWFVRSFRAA